MARQHMYNRLSAAVMQLAMLACNASSFANWLQRELLDFGPA